MVRFINESDYEQVLELFSNNIQESKEYISHGEIQMGIAIDKDNLSLNFKETWRNYLEENCSDTILVYSEFDTILGFIILSLEFDNDNSFGVIKDIVINKDKRGLGIGTLLMNEAFKVFNVVYNVDDIFLESGKDNHSAHNFFEKFGFECVSKVFMKKMGVCSSGQRGQSAKL